MQPLPVGRDRQHQTRPPMVVATGPTILKQQVKEERGAVLVVASLSPDSLVDHLRKTMTHLRGKGQGEMKILTA